MIEVASDAGVFAGTGGHVRLAAEPGQHGVGTGQVAAGERGPGSPPVPAGHRS